MIDYQQVINEFPWIIENDKKCILSPDSDGFLCGLAVTNLLQWDIVGYYDGKILILQEDYDVNDCVFLDVDINRAEIMSFGHHMVKYNKNQDIPNFNYSNCIQPNIIRDFDGRHDFQRKYPFGTIHLLLGILKANNSINTLTNNSIWPLLFTDGVWNNLFGYTENCLDWIEYLRINQDDNILNPLFCSSDYSFYDIMIGLNDFLRMRDEQNAQGYYRDGEYIVGGRTRRTGDKLKISNNRGNIINLVEEGDVYSLHSIERDRIINFITEMGEYIELNYVEDKWNWEDYVLTEFTKNDFSDRNLNNQTYLELMEQNPFSLAMTSGMNIEYTLE